MTFTDPTFWLALLQIIGVNIVLSGDNAVVIALAARSLPPQQQKKAVIWGSAAAVVMRIILTVVAVELLRLPYLKLVGAALLLWIGIQLLVPEEEEGGAGGNANAGLISAIRTILIADLVMSLDNVIAVAAAAKGSLFLLILGLLISIPLVIFGSTVLMRFMERFPIIVTIGAGLIGWVAGEMTATDPSIKDWVDANAAWLHYGAPVIGAILVIALGKWLANRSAEGEVDRPIVDLASSADQHASTGATGAAPPVRVLIAADETEPSLRGVRQFIAQARTKPGAVAVDLLNVQSPLHRDVTNFVEEAAIKSMHHDEGLQALAAARAALEEAGVPCVVHIGVGDFPHVVIHYAKSLGAQKVYLTPTQRSENLDLEATIEHMKRHVDLPVSVLQ